MRADFAESSRNCAISCRMESSSDGSRGPPPQQAVIKISTMVTAERVMVRRVNILSFLSNGGISCHSITYPVDRE
jgi:hypothetical protein